MGQIGTGGSYQAGPASGLPGTESQAMFTSNSNNTEATVEIKAANWSSASWWNLQTSTGIARLSAENYTHNTWALELSSNSTALELISTSMSMPEESRFNELVESITNMSTAGQRTSEPFVSVLEEITSADLNQTEWFTAAWETTLIEPESNKSSAASTAGATDCTFPDLPTTVIDSHANQTISKSGNVTAFELLNAATGLSYSSGLVGLTSFANITNALPTNSSSSMLTHLQLFSSSSNPSASSRPFLFGTSQFNVTAIVSSSSSSRAMVSAISTKRVASTAKSTIRLGTTAVIKPSTASFTSATRRTGSLSTAMATSHLYSNSTDLVAPARSVTLAAQISSSKMVSSPPSLSALSTYLLESVTNTNVPAAAEPATQSHAVSSEAEMVSAGLSGIEHKSLTPGSSGDMTLPVMDLSTSLATGWPAAETVHGSPYLSSALAASIPSSSLLPTVTSAGMIRETSSLHNLAVTSNSSELTASMGPSRSVSVTNVAVFYPLTSQSNATAGFQQSISTGLLHRSDTSFAAIAPNTVAEDGTITSTRSSSLSSRYSNYISSGSVSSSSVSSSSISSSSSSSSSNFGSSGRIIGTSAHDIIMTVNTSTSTSTSPISAGTSTVLSPTISTSTGRGTTISTATSLSTIIKGASSNSNSNSSNSKSTSSAMVASTYNVQQIASMASASESTLAKNPATSRAAPDPRYVLTNSTSLSYLSTFGVNETAFETSSAGGVSLVGNVIFNSSTTAAVGGGVTSAQISTTMSDFQTWTDLSQKESSQLSRGTELTLFPTVVADSGVIASSNYDLSTSLTTPSYSTAGTLEVSPYFSSASTSLPSTLGAVVLGISPSTASETWSYDLNTYLNATSNSSVMLFPSSSGLSASSTGLLTLASEFNVSVNGSHAASHASQTMGMLPWMSKSAGSLHLSGTPVNTGLLFLDTNDTSNGRSESQPSETLAETGILVMPGKSLSNTSAGTKESATVIYASQLSSQSLSIAFSATQGYVTSTRATLADAAEHWNSTAETAFFVSEQSKTSMTNKSLLPILTTSEKAGAGTGTLPSFATLAESSPLPLTTAEIGANNVSRMSSLASVMDSEISTVTGAAHLDVSVILQQPTATTSTISRSGKMPQAMSDSTAKGTLATALAGNGSSEVLAGLESLGPVLILMQPLQLGVPSRDRNTTYTLPPPYNTIIIQIPAGAWPEDGGRRSALELTAAVFALPRSLDLPGLPCGAGLNLGPAGLTLALPIAVSVPCNTSSALRGSLLSSVDAAVFSYHSNTGSRVQWERLIWPAGTAAEGVLDGVLWGATTMLTAHAGFVAVRSGGGIDMRGVYGVVAAVGGLAFVAMLAFVARRARNRPGRDGTGTGSRRPLIYLLGRKRVQPLEEGFNNQDKALGGSSWRERHSTTPAPAAASAAAAAELLSFTQLSREDLEGQARGSVYSTSDCKSDIDQVDDLGRDSGSTAVIADSALPIESPVASALPARSKLRKLKALPMPQNLPAAAWISTSARRLLGGGEVQSLPLNDHAGGCFSINVGGEPPAAQMSYVGSESVPPLATSCIAAAGSTFTLANTVSSHPRSIIITDRVAAESMVMLSNREGGGNTGKKILVKNAAPDSRTAEIADAGQTRRRLAIRLSKQLLPLPFGASAAAPAGSARIRSARRQADQESTLGQGM